MIWNQMLSHELNLQVPMVLTTFQLFLGALCSTLLFKFLNFQFLSIVMLLNSTSFKSQTTNNAKSHKVAQFHNPLQTLSLSNFHLA
jgi:hypothetical protein